MEGRVTMGHYDQRARCRHCPPDKNEYRTTGVRDEHVLMAHPNSADSQTIRHHRAARERV